MTEIGRVKNHKITHQDGGSDELSVEALAGDLADAQESTWSRVSGKPTTFDPAAHKDSHKDGGADEIDATGLVGRVTYVDRGNASAWDLQATDLPVGGAWAELDLSAIIPINTVAVQLQVELLDDLVGSLLLLAKSSTGEEFNTSSIRTQVADIGVRADLFVGVTSDRKIKYYRTNVTFTAINLVVRGWFV